LAALTAALGAASTQGTLAQPQPGGRTVWSGVYTPDQAARGKQAYDTSCSSCHQTGLTGAGEAPPIAGPPFMERWREDTVDSLFTRISRLMPFDDPATLSEDTYLDIVAYILQVNAFPAGDQPLKREELAEIGIVAKDGPGSVPDFALVQVTGCLTQAAGSAWTLTKGTEPVRTADPKASSEADLKAAGAAPLGTHTFQLMSVYPNPAPHAGHKMQAKGFLVRTGGEQRINVSSLTMIGADCGS
jgi:mono/diheme cytochrome c family protein